MALPCRRPRAVTETGSSGSGVAGATRGKGDSLSQVTVSAAGIVVLLVVLMLVVVTRYKVAETY